MPRKFRIAEAAKYLEVSTKTLRRWEASGKLLPKRSHGFHRYYTQKLLDSFKSTWHQNESKHVDLPEPTPSVLVPPGLPDFRKVIPMPVSKVSVFKTISFTILGSLVLAGGIFGGGLAYLKHNQNQRITPKSSTGLTLAESNQPKVLAAETSSDTYTFKVTIPSLFTEGAVFDKNISAPNLKMFNSVKVGTSTIKATNDTSILEMTGSGLTVATDATGKKLVFTVPSTDLTATGWTKSGSNIYLTTSTNKVGIGTTSPSTALDVSGGLTVSSGTVTFPTGSIANAALANPSITVTAGTGMTGGGSVALGGTVTMSLPQAVATTSTPTFSGLTVNGPEVIAPSASGTSLTIRASSTSPLNILDLTDSTGTTSYLSVSPTGSLTINGSTLTNTGLLESSGAIHLTNSSNTIVGTAIEGGWTMNSLAYTYRRQMTVTNNDVTTALPTNHEITVSLSGSTASQIFNAVRSDKNDFRVSSGSAEIARNITTFTASSIIFSFQLQSPIATSSSDTNYYMYYRNTTLTSPLAPTYTGNTQLDSADNVANWTSSSSGYTLSQETTIKQEGTGSVKIVATTGNFPTVATTSQGQLSTGVSKLGAATITYGGTNYIFTVGGKNGATPQTGVYKSTVDGSGNAGTFSIASQGQLPTALSGSGVNSITRSVTLNTGTGSDGTFDLSLGGGGGGCSGTNLTWTAGTSTCTFTVNATKNTWNFTSINVPAGTTVTTNGPFASASTNFFLTMRATGMATISGTINLSGKGYTSGIGPGAGSSGFVSDSNDPDCGGYSLGSSGAGYGGAGGASQLGVVGGSVYDTSEPGSGSGGIGGSGGGGITITSGGNMTINVISANGDGGDIAGRAGGSGGRVTLQSNGTVSFLGTTKSITANGGVGREVATGLCSTPAAGGGGGGRIIIQDSNSSMGGSGTITVNGGSANGSPQHGSPGGTGVISYLSSGSTYYLYNIGGLNGTAQTLVYKSTVDGSFNTGAWSTASQGQLPAALYNLSTVTANVGGTDYLYSIGGNNGTSDQTTVYKSTVDSSGNVGAWSTASQGQLPQALSEHTSTVATVGGTNYIYVIGGINGTTAQTTVYRAAIDGSGNIGAFTTVSQGQLPTGVYGHSAFAATADSTQYLYVLGGKNTTGTTQSTVYRATLDGSGNVGAWTTTAQNVLPQTLYGLSGVVSGTNVYVLGGNNGTSDQTTVYKGSLLDWTNYQATKTISSTNLTNKNGFQYKVYSSLTGSPARLRFSEDGVTWQTCTFTVSSANTWETKTCDITGIANTARDAVTRIQFDSSAATTNAFTLYFDDVNAVTSLFSGSAPGSTGGASIMGASDLLLNAQGTGTVKLNYDATNALAGTGGMIVYNGASTALMTLDSSGKLGIGSMATPSATLDVAGTASISGSLTFRIGAGSIQTTGFNPLTLGGLTTGNITLSPSNDIAGGFVAPNITNVSDLGLSNKLWRNIYGTTIYQGANQVCDVSGNCTGSSVVKLRENLGTLSPYSGTLDVLIGSNATASAKFAFKNVLTGVPTASISGSTANTATFIDGNGNMSTTNRADLTIGNSATYNSTGNTFINSNGVGNLGVGVASASSRLAVGGLTGTASYNLVRVDTATGNFYYDTSTQRNKENIATMSADWKTILGLEPKTFTDRSSGGVEVGYIAEEVNALGLTDLVIFDKEGLPNGLKYDKIPLYILEVVKDQERRLNEFTATTSAILTASIGNQISTKDLVVSGTTTLGDVVIAGGLNVGTLSLSGNGNINAIGNLKLQNMALGGVDFENGKILIDQDGNINIKTGVIMGNSTFRNTEVLKAGKNSISVVRNWKAVPATIMAIPNYRTFVWIENKSASGFTIKVDFTSTTDQTIEWQATW